MTFGQRLREMRKAKAMSQRELAAKSGISFAYVSKLETGSMTPPRHRTISALANALGADRENADELFGLAGKMPPDLLQHIDTRIIRLLRSFQSEVKPGARDLASLRRRIARLQLSQNQRKRLEQPVGREEEPFRAIVENSLDSIVVLGSGLEIIYENAAAAQMLGYETGEFVGQDALALIHPDDMSKTAHRLAKLAQTPGHADRAELRMRHKDGTWRVVEAVANNLLHHPAIRGILVDVREISESSPAAESRPPGKEYRLTESQQKVLALIAEGRTNKEIAERLVVSLSTVRFHVSSILRKTGATGRAEAAAIAVRRGLLS